MSFYNTNILILVFCSNPFMTFRHKMRHTCGASPYDNGKRSFHKFKTRGLLFKEVPQTLKSGIREVTICQRVQTLHFLWWIPKPERLKDPENKMIK